MHRSTKALLALAALNAVSCTDSAHAPAEEAGNLCTAVLSAMTTRQEACLAAAPSYVEHELADLPASCELLVHSVADGRARWNPSASAECVAWYQGTYAAAPCDATPPAEPESCRTAIEPLVPIGGTCTQPVDCIAGWCEFPEGDCPRPGRCVPLGGEGDACEPYGIWPSPVGNCEPGLECEYAPGAGDADWAFRCIVPPARVGQGEACGFSVRCEPGLSCQWRDARDQTTCEPVPEVGVGGACPRGFECARGLVCNAYTVCAQRVREGAGCTDPTAVCGDGMFCNGAGVCEAYPEDGAACSGAPRCMDGYCGADERCHAYGGTNDACSEAQRCAGYTHTCVAGVCQPVCPGW